MYEKTMMFPLDDFFIEGRLVLPLKAKSMIIIVADWHPYSNPEVDAIAQDLQLQGFATLVFDVLGASQSITQNKLTLEQVSRRIIAVTSWLHNHSEYCMYKLGYWALAKGSAPALVASVELGRIINAVVAVSGNINSVSNILPKVASPVLLVAAEYDFQTIKNNQDALHELNGSKQMVIIPGASRFFEEPEKKTQLRKYSIDWFRKYIPGEKTRSEPALKSQVINHV